MKEIVVTKSAAVTKFLDALNHPLISEIEQLRSTILSAVSGLTENIKWNGPNYCYENADRITMRIQPPKQIQLIFHRGAKKLAQPTGKLIDDNSQLLIWKENDRAVATFNCMDDIVKHQSNLIDIVNKWIEAAK
ncbi:DUF1801 domain-containing protein [Segetibacter aerophilus]|uniref:YdhG-like domain-containing protein n=1 Tax=Segetibacter aerophilus TaxID=670293 RepID=A0A512BB81_9BACT|nr:DUF1801 domain-containing protein [Segetibacter aerophilus]GEO09236.1 hypothetical protein SAE01_17320 [Segetibacter aerophilus]